MCSPQRGCGPAGPHTARHLSGRGMGCSRFGPKRPPANPPGTESCRSPLLWGFGVLAAREQGVMVVCVPTRRDKTQPRMDL